MLLQINTPLPNDIPLDLPLPEWLLIILLVVSFLAHILFVNLMLGGTLVTLWAQIRGLKNKEYDIFAHELAKTITVNKSLAVVLGVAPLLCINALYSIYFYSANSLTGYMWISIVPLVTIAFLLTYLHKYTWERLENQKVLHISILALAVLFFLFIPLIFLVNINLMLFPEKWGTIKGFISALFLPSVFPRYFHFLLASMAITGIAIFWYNKRKAYPFETIYPNFSRYDLKKLGYTIALWSSLAQLAFGTLLLFTLPQKGLSVHLVSMILTGAAISLSAIWWMWKALKGGQETIDKHAVKIVVALSITVVLMGSGRHVYRANTLRPHQQLMKKQTEMFEKESKAARDIAAIEQAKQDSAMKLNKSGKGLSVFKANCASCHKENEKLVGPSTKEMSLIYANDLQGLKKWIKQPGKKRADSPQMPGFPQLSDDELDQVSKYILTVK